MSDLTTAESDARLTRRLRLHFVPTMIRFRDVAAAIPVCVRTFDQSST